MQNDQKTAEIVIKSYTFVFIYFLLQTQLSRTGSIVITEVKVTDGGLYVCEASNPLGTDKIEIDLDVWSKFIDMFNA